MEEQRDIPMGRLRRTGPLVEGPKAGPVNTLAQEANAESPTGAIPRLSHRVQGACSAYDALHARVCSLCVALGVEPPNVFGGVSSAPDVTAIDRESAALEVLAEALGQLADHVENVGRELEFPTPEVRF